MHPALTNQLAKVRTRELACRAAAAAHPVATPSAHAEDRPLMRHLTIGAASCAPRRVSAPALGAMRFGTAADRRRSVSARR